MSYANATVSPIARIRAATGVVAIHALVGVGVVAGLTIVGVVPDDIPIIDTFDVPPETLPTPPTPTDPATPTDSVIPVPEAPIPLPRDNEVAADPVDPVFNDELVLRPTPPTGDIPAGPIGPIGPAFDPVAPVPRNGPQGWITNNDYAASQLRRGNEGTAGYRLVVGSDGRVDACEITRSTGHATLDRDTCRLIERRARFDAAKNNRGETVVGTYTGTVTWRIPE